MKEAMRLHPGVAFPLERYVPPGGATICGTWLPEGTNVSVNAAVIHFDKAIYGNDAEEFRPERWIEASPEQLKAMDRSFIAVSPRFLLVFTCAQYVQNPFCEETDHNPVRVRKSDVHRQEHLDPGDGQIHPSDPQTF